MHHDVLLARIEALEARIAAIEAGRPAKAKKPRRKRSRKPAAWRLQHAEAIRPLVAKAMSGVVAKVTASEIAEAARLHVDQGMLRSITCVCDAWGMKPKKSGSRRVFTFTGQELQ